MSDPYFFGYGSLVNRDTHSYPRAEPRSLAGWSRTWQGTGLRDVAFLTFVPTPGVTIEGLIAAVPNANWAALDERERAYARHAVEVEAPGPVAIYAVEPKHQADGDHPILLSYLDTVIQGYLKEFGDEGVQRFFQTTQGWDRPVLNDRRDPIYPRATVLSQAEQTLVDQELARARAT